MESASRIPNRAVAGAYDAGVGSEWRSIQNGRFALRRSAAHNSKVAAPQKGEEVTFVDGTLWARLAEIAQPFPGPNGAPLGPSSPAQRSAATQRWQESDIIQPRKDQSQASVAPSALNPRAAFLCGDPLSEETGQSKGPRGFHGVGI
jgi:hypothetical protein